KRVADRNHERDRRDHQHQHRDEQSRDAEEDQDGLPLIRHQVDLTQRVREPDDRRQADQDQQKRAESRAENVAVERTHWAGYPPDSATSSRGGAPPPQRTRALNRIDGKTGAATSQPARRCAKEALFSRLSARTCLISNRMDPSQWPIPRHSPSRRSPCRRAVFWWYSRMATCA